MMEPARRCREVYVVESGNSKLVCPWSRLFRTHVFVVGMWPEGALVFCSCTVGCWTSVVLLFGCDGEVIRDDGKAQMTRRR